MVKDQKYFYVQTEQLHVQKASNGLSVKGEALPFEKVSRNGFRYIKESVENTFESLIGASMLFNHNQDRSIGHVKNAYVQEGALFYEADLDPEDEVARKVARGDISKVSIQVSYDEDKSYIDDEGTVHAWVKEFYELSAVTIPGFVDTSIQLAESLKKKEEVDLTPPKAAKNNAKRALEIKEETDSDCGTRVGWERANQLASGENLSEDTVKRMASFNRHRKNSDGNPREDCGALMWLAWGGDAGVDWAIEKSKEIDAKEGFKMKKQEKTETSLESVMQKVKESKTLTEEEVKVLSEAVAKEADEEDSKDSDKDSEEKTEKTDDTEDDSKESDEEDDESKEEKDEDDMKEKYKELSDKVANLEKMVKAMQNKQESLLKPATEEQVNAALKEDASESEETITLTREEFLRARKE